MLNRYDGNFISDDIISNEPVLGAKEWCWKVWNGDKAELVVSSGRCRSHEGVLAIKDWLENWGFPPIPVSPIKPVAHVYIDDRAYRFDGDWDAVDIDYFVKFRAWWDE